MVAFTSMRTWHKQRKRKSNNIQSSLRTLLFAIREVCVCVHTSDWVHVAFMLRILLILRYTQFRWMYVRCAWICECECECMALIRYANKYRYFYANIAMLSRVHVETCRIRFFNLLNWVLFGCSRSLVVVVVVAVIPVGCLCFYFEFIRSFGYFHLLLPSFRVDIRIGCSWFTSLIRLNIVMVFGVAWTLWTPLNHDDTMPHRANVGGSFFLFFFGGNSFSLLPILIREISASEIHYAYQAAISKEISVQQFGVKLYPVQLRIHLSMFVFVCSYTLERLNNVKVIFISIFWINFSRKINNDLFSILAVYVCIHQFWFLFPFCFVLFRFIFRCRCCVGAASANGLESWDNSYFGSRFAHPSLFGCSHCSNKMQMQIIRIDLKFRYFSVQIDYMVYLQTCYKAWGHRTQYRYQLKRCHIGSTLNEITSFIRIYLLQNAIVFVLNWRQRNTTQHDITLRMIQKNATQKLNYLIVSSVSIRVCRYCRVQTTRFLHSRHSKKWIDGRENRMDLTNQWL